MYAHRRFALRRVASGLSARRIRGACRVVVVAAAVALGGGGLRPEAAEPLRITHGIASGDVTATDAVVWARADRAARILGITNVVWLATDVHHARLLRYEPTGELAGLVFHEFVAGPAHAASAAPGPLSTTFSPIELFARGRRPDPARPGFLNFGVVRVAADGLLVVEIRDADGAVATDEQGRPGALTLVPTR